MSVLRDEHKDDPVGLRYLDECEANGVEWTRLRMDGNYFGSHMHIGRHFIAQQEALAKAANEERIIRAAETQATYAKRAFERSNIALWLSGIAIVVAGFFALLDHLK